MTKISQVAKVLSTIQVGDEPTVLDCSPELAESVWFNHVYYREHRQFELVVERFGKSSCKVSIRRWEDSPDHTVNGGMIGPWAFLALILTILGMLWLM